MQKLIYKAECQLVYEEWLNTLPSSLTRELRAYLPEYADCYRIVGDADGHYFLLQVVDHFADLPVTCDLLHGRFSFAAGMLVIGVPLAELLACDCGILQFPYPLIGDVNTIHVNVPLSTPRYRLPKPLLYRQRFMPGSRNSKGEVNSQQNDHSFVPPELSGKKWISQHLYDEWIATLPSAVAAEMRLYLPAVADCYRIRGDDDGHYFLDQVVESIADFPVTCNLLHGKNSSNPGDFVTGVPLAEIVTCDCGTLEFPTMRGIGGRTFLDVPCDCWTRYNLTGPLRFRRSLPPNERSIYFN